jgi:hypothetical protein
MHHFCTEKNWSFSFHVVDSLSFPRDILVNLTAVSS